MLQGLQCFDDNGNIILDVTDSLTRYLGAIHTNGTNGSIYNAELLSGRLWYEVISDSCYQFSSKPSSIGITLVNGTLSWAYEISSNTVPVTIIYGVY
jgi:hypothetical protein